jgi:hypothetical protein
MMLDLPHTLVPMLMRGNTPSTLRSPPHQSRPTGNPPNLQPATVSEGERGGRGLTSRLTLMREAPDCMQPPTARHVLSPRSNTSHPPQQQDTVHRELCPGTGKGASVVAGPPCCDTLPAAGRTRAPPQLTPAPPPQPHTTRPPPTTTGGRKGEYPVVIGEGGQRSRRTASPRHKAGPGPESQFTTISKAQVTMGRLKASSATTTTLTTSSRLTIPRQDPQLSQHISPQQACGFFAGVHGYLGPHPLQVLGLDFLLIQQTGRRLFQVETLGYQQHNQEFCQSCCVFFQQTRASSG